MMDWYGYTIIRQASMKIYSYVCEKGWDWPVMFVERLKTGQLCWSKGSRLASYVGGKAQDWPVMLVERLKTGQLCWWKGSRLASYVDGKALD
jgi:hypothetical protein